VNIIGVRNVALGILVLGFVGCSSTPVPTAQNASTLTRTSKVRPDMSCPFTFTTGDNGTYTVGVGDSCVMNSPANQTCELDTQPGYEYSFEITSGGSNGTLSGGTIGETQATFNRTSSGKVYISLLQYQYPLGTCRISGYITYGTVVLDT